MPATRTPGPSVLLRRTGAYVLDVVLLFAVLAPAGYVVQRLLGLAPDAPREVYAALLLNFSLPAWLYFAWADRSRRGATPGKRAFGLRTAMVSGGRVGAGRALGRTAVKMVPWELTHAASFLLVPAVGTFTPASVAGLVAAYALIFAYLGVAWRTRGRRSVHDVAAGTQVMPSGR